MNIRLWRTRVAFLVLSIALWVGAWGVRDMELIQTVLLGAAVMANVVLVFATFLPTEDAFRMGRDIGKGIGYQDGFHDGTEDAFRKGEDIGKGIGYQGGFRDGLQQGTRLMDSTGDRDGAALTGLGDDDKVETKIKEYGS